MGHGRAGGGDEARRAILTLARRGGGVAAARLLMLSGLRAGVGGGRRAVARGVALPLSTVALELSASYV